MPYFGTGFTDGESPGYDEGKNCKVDEGEGSRFSVFAH